MPITQGGRAGSLPLVAFCLAALASTLGAGCAHRGSAALSEPARRLASEAAKVGPIAFEEDFIDAKLVYRALPLAAAERAPLRRRLINYLLGPLAAIDLDPAKRQGELIGDDDLDRSVASFRDALD